MRKPGRFLALAVVFTSLTALASGGSSTSLQTFGLPNPNSQPKDITVTADGTVWFTESSDSVRRIGRLDTKGKLTEFSMPSAPDQIVVGPDGNIWFTLATSIGRITPTGVFTEFVPPVEGGLTSFPRDITSGPDGNLWFTMGSKIFKMTTSGATTEYLVSNSSNPNPNPQGITAGPDGAVWFTEYNANKIGRIDTDGNITEFGPVDQPLTIGAGPDGNLWFTCPASHTIGRITPTGAITLFPLSGFPQPWNPVAGPDGNVWFTEYLANQVARITPAGVVTQVVSVPGAWGLARGVGNTLWVTHLDQGKVSKLTVAP